jgi:hypothetical protein
VTERRATGRSAINIGWLDGSHPNLQGEVPENLVAALCELGRHRVHIYRGYHYCELCPPRKDERGYLLETLAPCENHYELGDAEIRVFGDDGVTFAAPNMIAHYVAAHGYKPPEAFISAAIRTAAAIAHDSPTTP